MSLLHQVLQDIDKRDARLSALPSALQMPSDSAVLSATTCTTAADATNSAVLFRIIQPFLWLIFPLLLAVVYLLNSNTQEWPEKSTINTAPALTDASVNVTGENKTAAIVAKPLFLQPEPVIEEVVYSPDPVTESTVFRTVDGGNKYAVNKNTELIKNTLTDSTAGKSGKNKNNAEQETVNSSVNSRLMVVRSNQKGQQYYLRAVGYMAERKFHQAMIAVDQALAIDRRDDYLAVKLRLCLELKAEDQFLQLYRQNAAVMHPYWLAVAAPGLHMLGHFEDAIRVYQQLILLQPEIVNWSLALVQALQSAGREQQATSVLISLYQQKRLTPDQQRWVEQTLKNIR